MNIGRLYDERAAHNGMLVDVDCVVVSLNDGQSYLCLDSESFHNGRRILVDDGGVIARVLSKCSPPFVGTETAHVECVSIAGTLVLNGNTPSLTNLTKCKVKTPFGEFQVPLDPDSAFDLPESFSAEVGPDGTIDFGNPSAT